MAIMFPTPPYPENCLVRSRLFSKVVAYTCDVEKMDKNKKQGELFEILVAEFMRMQTTVEGESVGIVNSSHISRGLLPRELLKGRHYQSIHRSDCEIDFALTLTRSNGEKVLLVTDAKSGDAGMDVSQTGLYLKAVAETTPPDGYKQLGICEVSEAKMNQGAQFAFNFERCFVLYGYAANIMLNTGKDPKGNAIKPEMRKILEQLSPEQQGNKLFQNLMLQHLKDSAGGIPQDKMITTPIELKPSSQQSNAPKNKQAAKSKAPPTRTQIDPRYLLEKSDQFFSQFGVLARAYSLKSPAGENVIGACIVPYTLDDVKFMVQNFLKPGEMLLLEYKPTMPGRGGN